MTQEAVARKGGGVRSGGLWVARGYHAEMAGLSATAVGLVAGTSAAVIGFAASTLTTRATLRSNRQIARDERLWSLKTELYEGLVSATERIASDVAQRQDLWATLYPMGDPVRVPSVEDLIGEFEEAATSVGPLLAKAVMYASPEVFKCATQFHAQCSGLVGRVRWGYFSPDERERDPESFRAGLDELASSPRMMAVDLRNAIRSEVQGERQAGRGRRRLAWWRIKAQTRMRFIPRRLRR